MIDSAWVELPLGNQIAAHKHPLNLSVQEVLQFQDLNATRAPGSLSLRKISENASPADLPEGTVVKIGQQNRPNGEKVLAAVSRLLPDFKTLTVVNPDNGFWISTFGQFPNLNLGGGEVDLAISPDAIRSCGEEGLKAVVKLGTLPYIEGGIEVMPRQFHETDGRQPINFVGIGYVLWDGKVENDDLVGIDITVVPLADDFDQGTFFDNPDSVSYFSSVTFEGGQESPPVFIGGVPQFAGRSWVSYTVQILRRVSFPFGIKSVNIYRSKRATGFGISEDAKQAVLIKTLPVYKDNDDYANWSLVDVEGQPGATVSGLDKNESSVIGGTYFDRQQLSTEVTTLSPNRRHHRLFSDRLFAWGVVADDGKIYGNRLYYSHVNGLGISCYDIIPPANYVEFPFNIVGLVSVRSHRIVIGDSKYAIGYFGGGAIQNWRIYESETEMGCRAPDSVADTPFGAAYVGYDGIYVLNGLESQGPLARGIIYSTEDEFDWSNAKAEFSQDDQEYVVVVPSQPLHRNNPLIVAINLRDGGIRRIEGVELNPSAVGKDSVGKILLAGQQGIFRLETAYGPGTSIDTPNPVVETGLRRFTQGTTFQKIRNVAINGTWGPGSLMVTVTSHAGLESTKTIDAQPDGLVIVGMDALVSPGYSHKFKFEYVSKPNDVVSDFQIDRVWVDVVPCERSFQ